MRRGDDAVLDAPENGIAWLGGLVGRPFEPCLDCCWRRNPILPQYVEGVAVGGWIGRARPGSDMRGIVAGDVRDDERQHRRQARRGKAAALDRRKVLAHGIDLL